MHPSTDRLAVTLAAAAAALAAVAAPGAARADDAVRMLVLKEHQVGTAAQHQPYVDKEAAMLAKEAGWASASGSYQTTRAGAAAYVASAKPHYGIFTLAAFLAWKGKYQLVVVGQELSAAAGGQQYFLISTSAADAAGCKGKPLATEFADDARFANKIIFGGKLALASFEVVKTTRVGATIRKVIAGEAACGLVDDAGLALMAEMPDARAVKSVWQSQKLPPVVVAAFAAAPAAERKALQGGLSRLCTGEGAQTCADMGIAGYKAAGAAAYAAVVTAYGR